MEYTLIKKPKPKINVFGIIFFFIIVLVIIVYTNNPSEIRK
jgi:TRAP-type mannitol/chloroaromatic compound transport system permease small subunit